MPGRRGPLAHRQDDHDYQHYQQRDHDHAHHCAGIPAGGLGSRVVLSAHGSPSDSWAATLALTGFHYSGVSKSLSVTGNPGSYFWSNGYAWGTVQVGEGGKGKEAKITVLSGDLALEHFSAGGGKGDFKKGNVVKEGQDLVISLK